MTYATYITKYDPIIGKLAYTTNIWSKYDPIIGKQIYVQISLKFILANRAIPNMIQISLKLTGPLLSVNCDYFEQENSLFIYLIHHVILT
jgi:hypothetical protein